jgi:hypothetical protein
VLRLAAIKRRANLFIFKMSSKKLKSMHPSKFKIHLFQSWYRETLC